LRVEIDVWEVVKEEQHEAGATHATEASRSSSTCPNRQELMAYLIRQTNHGMHHLASLNPRTNKEKQTASQPSFELFS
jgi:hypothetical protein